MRHGERLRDLPCRCRHHPLHGRVSRRVVPRRSNQLVGTERARINIVPARVSEEGVKRKVELTKQSKCNPSRCGLIWRQGFTSYKLQISCSVAPNRYSRVGHLISDKDWVSPQRAGMAAGS